MLFNKATHSGLLKELEPYHATLVAVSKTKPTEAVREAFDAGQKDFGENYVQELSAKAEALPADVRWHFIGHLQSNKIKQIISTVTLIQSVDSFKLLAEINKQAKKASRIADCLLQVYIATEETKFGLSFKEADKIFSSNEFTALENIRIKGLMGMASLTEDKVQIRKEFHSLASYFNQLQASVFKSKIPNGKVVNLPETEGGLSPGKPVKRHASNLSPQILSMGMTSDYKIALDEGSTMIRVGSALFGDRN